MTTKTRKATCKHAILVGWIGHAAVRLANSGDHWPGYADDMTLRRGYWVGDDREHIFVGPRKMDVAIHAIDCGYIDHETAEADVKWL